MGEAMRARRVGPSASLAVRGVLLAGLVAAVAFSFPGHLTYDSISQLAEGRANRQQTWGPAMYAWLLGVSDRLAGGTRAYLLFSAALLGASLLSLPTLRPRTSWIAVPIAAAIVLSPAVMLYQGIVWKDVMFANLTVAGFVALAHAARAGSGWRRILALGLAAALLATACLVRQNGLIPVAVAAVTAGWLAGGRDWRRGALAAVVSLAVLVLLAQLFDRAIQPPGAEPGRRTDTGLRILLHYDILGAVAHDPTLPLGQIDRVRPQTDDLIRARAPLAYSPERVDRIEQHPDLRRGFWRTPEAAIERQWLAIVTGRPGAYLAHRWDAFRWVFLTPRLDRCLPVAVGVEGPPDQLAALGLAAGQDAADRRLARYALAFAKTPFYSHAAYALLAATLMGFLLVRRQPADIAVAGLLLAALAVAGSYFVISIACDYRYLYLLDLAALTGLLYVALDPAPPRRVRRSS